MHCHILRRVIGALIYLFRSTPSLQICGYSLYLLRSLLAFMSTAVFSTDMLWSAAASIGLVITGWLQSVAGHCVDCCCFIAPSSPLSSLMERRPVFSCFFLYRFSYFRSVLCLDFIGDY